MRAPYPIIQVHLGRSPVELVEQMGTKPKFWFRRTEPGPEQFWLFKYARLGTGEDWSEKIASEVAELLGIPHSRVELAVCRDCPGIVTLDFTDGRRYGHLVHGNELMAETLQDYPREQRYRVPQHTVDGVSRVLDRPFVRPPPNDQCPRPLPEAVMDASGLFAGYLLLDALIGNTDRHHENWGILVRPGSEDRPNSYELAPSFDHASCLGRELSEDERADRLHTKDRNRTVPAYAERCRSALFGSESDRKPLGPLEALLRFGKHRPDALQAWVDRLSELSDDAVQDVVQAVPGSRMTGPAKEFAGRLLECNRKRILECRLRR